MTLYFTMWVNKCSAKDSVYLVFAISYNALRFSLHMAESVVREIQKTKRSVIVLFLSSSSERVSDLIQFSLAYLCIQFVFSATTLHFLVRWIALWSKGVYIPSLHFFCENNPKRWPVGGFPLLHRLLQDIFTYPLFWLPRVCLSLKKQLPYYTISFSWNKRLLEPKFLCDECSVNLYNFFLRR